MSQKSSQLTKTATLSKKSVFSKLKLEDELTFSADRIEELKEGDYAYLAEGNIMMGRDALLAARMFFSLDGDRINGTLRIKEK